MYTQFYGNYLLNNGYITASQLAEALEIKKNTRVKLGVLAINAGIMNAEQVEVVHNAQERVDKKFGDLAIELGFMTPEELETLLSSQKTGTLLLGQALVDKGYMDNKNFEKSIKEYKETYKISDTDISEITDSVKNIITDFYHFENHSNKRTLTDYVTLLFKNIIRFIGDDFTPLEPSVKNSFKCINVSSQNIVGPFSAFTAIEAKDDAFCAFASVFAGEEIKDINEFTFAATGEFLNLHNGLFTVNMSNEKNIELEMKPQIANRHSILSLVGCGFCIPVAFSFGTVNFIVSNID